MQTPPELSSFDGPITAAVFGATGGIGGALVSALERCGGVHHIAKYARQTAPGTQIFDITEERSIDAAIATLRARAPLHLCLIATGQLSSTRPAPEKSNAALGMDEMMAQFAVNSAGPALLAARLAPLLDRTRKSAIGVLSARVGSVSDNRLGGWHSYRASKAALNMLVRTIAIDLARKNEKAVCVGLHPGTVDTGLSRPFHRAIPETRIFAPADAATQLLMVLNDLCPAQTGQCLDYAGRQIQP